MSNEMDFGGAFASPVELEDGAAHEEAAHEDSVGDETTSLFIENGGDAISSDSSGGELHSDGLANALLKSHPNGRSNGKSYSNGNGHSNGKSYSNGNGHSNGNGRSNGSISLNGSGGRKGEAYPIVVHSHLRWDWVWQRPQQFLTRLSQRHAVLFVQGPLVEDGDFEPYSRLSQASDFPNVTLMDMVFPSAKFADGVWVDAERTRMVREVMEQAGGKFDSPVQWFYDPMAVSPFVGQIGERVNVYDCMDQLSQFKFAPPELIERERMLLEAADVVFAGGRKMWEDKKRINPNSHFYGCGVDVEHFAQARSPLTRVPEKLAAISGPVLGYFGVVDERMDYELVAKIADARPDWTLAIVGPTCKVEASDLPQRANILWLGGQKYEDLPAFTKGFDVCLMPFALNEATEYINPTKALEYMATGRPIVSTPVPDVVSNFTGALKIANSHEEFIQMCDDALNRPSQDDIEAGLAMADRNTWDSIVAQLEAHVERALAKKKAAVAAGA